MTIADISADDLDSSTEATLQHIAMLYAREQKLAQMRIEAEEQMLYRLGVAHGSGGVTADQLYAAHERYNALRMPGSSKRWDAHISVPWIRFGQVRRWLPNGPEGTWTGAWPLGASDRAPIGGQSVVYVLFDPENEPCYVGSTKRFRTRLKRHAADGKVFVNWQAYPCQDREHAYEVEDRVLKEYKPRMNRKAGR